MRRTQVEEPPAAPASDQQRRIYASWKCTECGIACGGYILPSDFRTRRCEGIPKTRHTDGGRICGGLMAEIYRSKEAA